MINCLQKLGSKANIGCFKLLKICTQRKVYDAAIWLNNVEKACNFQIYLNVEGRGPFIGFRKKFGEELQLFRSCKDQKTHFQKDYRPKRHH